MIESNSQTAALGFECLEEQTKVTRQQCDQNWRKFVTLANFSLSWAIFESLFSIWQFLIVSLNLFWYRQNYQFCRRSNIQQLIQQSVLTRWVQNQNRGSCEQRENCFQIFIFVSLNLGKRILKMINFEGENWGKLIQLHTFFMKLFQACIKSFRNGPFRLFGVFFKQTINVKNAHPVCSAGIRTHNLQVVRIIP